MGNSDDIKTLSDKLNENYNTLLEGLSNYQESFMAVYHENQLLAIMALSLLLIAIISIVLLFIKIVYWRKKYKQLKRTVRRDIDECIYNL